jgi:hypothetical protein
MYVLCATFEPELALNKVAELLALADTPDRLAEKLAIQDELDRVKAGVAGGSFKRLVQDIERIRKFLDLEKEMEDIRAGKWAFAFMGKSFAEGKLKALAEKRRKFGSLIEAPRWYYQQERVRLLSAMRDAALEGSEQGDAEWVESANRPIPYPIVDLFEKGDITGAKTLAAYLEKPLKDLDAKWILTQLEGNRALHFNFEKSIVMFYAPVRKEQPASSLM